MRELDFAYVGLGVHEEVVYSVAAELGYYADEGVRVSIRDGVRWDDERLRRAAVGRPRPDAADPPARRDALDHALRQHGASAVLADGARRVLGRLRAARPPGGDAPCARGAGLLRAHHPPRPRTRPRHRHRGRADAPRRLQRAHPAAEERRARRGGDRQHAGRRSSSRPRRACGCCCSSATSCRSRPPAWRSIRASWRWTTRGSRASSGPTCARSARCSPIRRSAPSTSAGCSRPPTTPRRATSTTATSARASRPTGSPMPRWWRERCRSWRKSCGSSRDAPWTSRRPTEIYRSDLTAAWASDGG